MAERIKHSFGQTYINQGSKLSVNEGKYAIDYMRMFYLFDIIPFGAVRMTKSDKWKVNPNHPDPKKRQRLSVQRYFAFKNRLVEQATKMGYELGISLDIVFLIPMPDGWSEKKKDKMNGMPHQTKPDADNLIKGVKDSLKKDDSDVFWEKTQKYWATTGSIIIYG